MKSRRIRWDTQCSGRNQWVKEFMSQMQHSTGIQQALNKWWVYTIEEVPSLKKKSLFRSSAYHFKRFILRCTTFQVVRILLQYCFCFIFWDFFSFLIYLFWWKGIWDLSSPTRDPAHIPCIGRRILNHWTTGEVPWILLKVEIFK